MKIHNVIFYGSDLGSKAKKQRTSSGYPPQGSYPEAALVVNFNNCNLNGIALAMPFLLYVVLKYAVGTLLPFLQQRAF